jgi:hypothetical protein
MHPDSGNALKNTPINVPGKEKTEFPDDRSDLSTIPEFSTEPVFSGGIPDPGPHLQRFTSKTLHRLHTGSHRFPAYTLLHTRPFIPIPREVLSRCTVACS